MKKFALFLVLTCFAAGFLFAQDYTVQTVTGRVLKGTGYDKANIDEGEVLTAGTIVSVSAGAVLVLTDGEHTFTITAGYTGMVINSPQISRIRRGPPAARIDRRPSSRTAPAPAHHVHAAEEESFHHDFTAEGHFEEVIFSNEHVEIKVVIDTEPEAKIEENGYE